jgi:outer membrane protein OmpA-like peptidoglycan-associated protein
MKLFLLSLVSISASFVVLSQGARLNYADKLYDNMRYFEASEAYEDVVERTKDSASVVPKIARSYDKLGNVEKSVSWYNYMLRNDVCDADDLIQLALNSRQVESNELFISALDKHDNKFGKTAYSERMLADFKRESEISASKNNFTLSAISTTNEEAILGLSFYETNRVIVSSRKRTSLPVKQIDGWTNEFYYTLGFAKLSEDKHLGAISAIKVKGKNMHIASLCYDLKNDQVFFTANYSAKAISAGKTNPLYVYKGNIEGTTIVNYEALPFNSEDYSCAYPSISDDGSKLYFSSNMEGGYGGMDIYVVQIDEQGNYSTPQNLGKAVNSPKDEITPHINSEGGVLFFSSNGHFGMGGYDIYVAKLSEAGEARSVENLGSDINSSRDDISFVNNNEQTLGFMVSNRSGMDLPYSFDQQISYKSAATVKGTLINNETQDLIVNMGVQLRNSKGSVVAETISDDQGRYNFELEGIADDFSLFIRESDDFREKVKSVEYNEKQSDYIKNLNLQPFLYYFFAGHILDEETHEPLSDVRIIVRESGETALIDEFLTDENGSFEGNDLGIEGPKKVDFEVVIAREGYITKTVRFSETVTNKKKIDLNEYLNIALHKVEVGKTDLGAMLGLKPIYFDLNSSYLRSDAKTELDRIVEIMKENAAIIVELRSHTDSQGELKYNTWLSDRRAKSSANYIISQGISKDRIAGKGFGQSQLVVTDEEIKLAKTKEEKEALHQQNRRTEFIVVGSK